MAHEIASKLRLTAAVVGAVTRKDLAAAFRRVNASTPFDVDRAHKWLQGRANPRELQLYDDWARLLDLGRPGQWIAECDTESFLDAICARHGTDRDALRRLAEPPGNPERQQERGSMLAGAYACYSHAQSPYHLGKIIRGSLVIEAAARRKDALLATYSEAIAVGRIRLRGPVLFYARAVCLNLHMPSHEGMGPLFCSLFLPTLPVSVLAGVMCGPTLIDPSGQPPYATRVAMFRVPAAGAASLEASNRYMDSAEDSASGDLAALGLPVAARAPELGAQLESFLRPGGDRPSGFDQVRVAEYVDLVAACDRLRFQGGLEDTPPAGFRPLPVAR
jgi:hypothetical protein